LTETSRSKTALYAVIDLSPAIREDAALRALDALLAAAPVACVLLRAARQGNLDASIAKSLVTRAQKRNVAALVADNAQLARLIKADGVHISWSKDIVAAYAAARGELGDHAMIGADAGRSRDDAMQLGEDGADYVAFGIPSHVEDRATAEERQLALIGWWQEIFEVPCVAFDAATPERAGELAAEGADFVVAVFDAEQKPDEITKLARAFDQAITQVEAHA
jgi:thiamine-phosphate pyrophosphorylase